MVLWPKETMLSRDGVGERNQQDVEVRPSSPDSRILTKEYGKSSSRAPAPVVHKRQEIKGGE